MGYVTGIVVEWYGKDRATEVMDPIHDIVGEKGGQLNQFFFFVLGEIPQ